METFAAEIHHLLSDLLYWFESNGFGQVDLISLMSLVVALFALVVASRARHQKTLERYEELLDRVAELETLVRESVSDEGASAADAATLSSSKKKLNKSPTPSSTVHSGLKKTRKHFFSRLASIIGGKKEIDAETYEALEELLITSDLGVHTTEALLSSLKEKVADGEELSADELRTHLKTEIEKILLSKKKGIDRGEVADSPLVIIVVGVNGVGKTTTIGKLANLFKEDGAKVLVAACDTFRAAAVEQIQAWGERVGVSVHAGEPEAKPSTIAYQAAHRARDEKFDVLIVDTAGRLHTRVNLMNELANVVQIIERELPGKPDETLLVLDASTGQNALQQAREFNDKTSLSGIVVTKLDGTPKGGIVVAIKQELDIPIRYIGVGEGVLDLKEFSASEFVAALFDDGDLEDLVDTVETEAESDEDEEAPRRVKRKRQHSST